MKIHLHCFVYLDFMESRSGCPEVFCKKDVLKNFAKFIESLQLY